MCMCCRLAALLKARARSGWEAIRDNLFVALKQLGSEAQVGADQTAQQLLAVCWLQD